MEDSEEKGEDAVKEDEAGSSDWNQRLLRVHAFVPQPQAEEEVDGKAEEDAAAEEPMPGTQSNHPPPRIRRLRVCLVMAPFFIQQGYDYVQIVQNIGRVVRPNPGAPPATVLLPCWVDRAKYEACAGDEERRDATIREDLQAGGNFNGILNVMSALKQEDQELYDLCLHYPRVFTSQERAQALRQDGFRLEAQVGAGGAEETCAFLLGSESLGEHCNSDAGSDASSETDWLTEEERLQRIADRTGAVVEVHAASLENPVQTYRPATTNNTNNANKTNKVVRLFRISDDDEEEDEEDEEEGEEEEAATYRPIVCLNGDKQSDKKLRAPSAGTRPRMAVNHTNPELMVLWSLRNELSAAALVSSGVIDCEVVRMDPMEAAEAIVIRANERERMGGHRLPKACCKNKKKEYTDAQKQEHRDAQRLRDWRKKCPARVCQFLNAELPGWNVKVDLAAKAMQDARDLVARAKDRERARGRLLPKQKSKDPQEAKDAAKLGGWKMALKCQGHQKCPDDVVQYLDAELPGWRAMIDLNEKAMQDARDVVQRAKDRERASGRLLPLHKSKDPQEAKDANKLDYWKMALKGQGHKKCPDEVRDYLDAELPGWRVTIDLDEKAMQDARDLVQRAKDRERAGGRLLPKHKSKDPQEAKDAAKLGKWKLALKGQGTSKCPDDVVQYLDAELPGWRTDLDEKTMQDARDLAQRAKDRERAGGRLLPRNGSNDPQEAKDATKLGKWKMALKGQGKSKCPDEVRDYLDAELPGWRTDLDEKAMQDARDLVRRAKDRKQAGGRLLPRKGGKDPQEAKDANKLNYWKMALKGQGHKKCPDEVLNYLDAELPGWRPVDPDQTTAEQTTEQTTTKQPTEQTTTEQPKPRKKTAKQPTTLNQPTAPKETEEQTRARHKSALSELHREFKTLSPANLHALFQAQPERWLSYHALVEKNDALYPPEEVPWRRVAALLDQRYKGSGRRGAKHVADLGCGTARLANHFRADPRFAFHCFDHVALPNPKAEVQCCDMSALPLEDGDTDIAVFCLSLWGPRSAVRQYLREAFRVLDPLGRLYVLEPAKRWTSVSDATEATETAVADQLRALLEQSGFRVVSAQTDRFCLFECVRVAETESSVG